jgi:hypothetical protein
MFSTPVVAVLEEDFVVHLRYTACRFTGINGKSRKEMA